ncbi:MAG: acyltransferase family protein [Prevotella sp.]
MPLCPFIRVIALSPQGIGFSYKDREVSFPRQPRRTHKKTCAFLCRLSVSDRLMRHTTLIMHSDETLCPQPSVGAKTTRERLYWIDWMKAIGISLIVYGHLFSMFDIYVYVFNVPLFFVISGFLFKEEEDNRLFGKKVFFNLFVPLLILSSLNYIIKIADFVFLPQGRHAPDNPLAFCIKLLLGVHGAVGALWFVYTLMILKDIHQYVRGGVARLTVSGFCLICAYVINNYPVELYGYKPFEKAWAIPDTFICYPFFIIGYYMRRWRKALAQYKPDRYTVLWIALSLLCIFICGHNHRYVYLFICGYGDSIWLCLFGGIAGTAFVFFLSKLLERWRWRLVDDISIGTIIILGLHFQIIGYIRLFADEPSFLDVLFAVGITVGFVPVIRLCGKYFPAVMGLYRVHRR